jgi:hypothetical protein
VVVATAVILFVALLRLPALNPLSGRAVDDVGQL